jgi:hypothetical protein
MPTKITPSLESITVRAKYIIPETNFDEIKKMLIQSFPAHWGRIREQVGKSITLCNIGKKGVVWGKYIEQVRPGVPVWSSIVPLENLNNGTLVEVECRPAMWFLVSKNIRQSFMENQIQEALIECRIFVKQVMSIFNGKEVEPVSVYPIIQRTEIKSRLLNLGLKEVVSPLDKAERHIVQNNFIDSLKSSRTAFEKMIDWQMKKRGLEKTNNYKNDLERLKSKGFLDLEITGLLQTYYKCLSIIAVHEKGEVEPGFYEAQMGYGMTLIMLQYFIDKLP